MSAAIAVSPVYPVDRVRPASAPRFTVLLAGYLGTLLVLRLFISSTLQWDEAEQTIFSQSLRWGYSEQPPLYTWLTWATFLVFGPGVLGLTVLKTSIFSVLFALTYRTGLRTLGDARLARYAAFSLLLVPYFAWEANRDGTHSLLLAVAVAGTVDAALRLIAAGRTRDYVALGAWLGAGALSKYTAGLSQAGVLAATLMIPAARRRLFDRRIFLTLGLAIVMVAPHLAWLVGHRAAVVAVLEDRAAVGSAGRGRGVVSLIRELAILGGPLLTVMALYFPSIVRRPVDADDSAAVARRWLGWYLAAIIVGLTLAITAGATRILSHWLPPLFTPLPVYLFLRCLGRAVPRRRLRRYGVALTLAALVALVSRASLLWRGGPGGGRWHAGRDLFYETAARHWAGLRGATFVTDDPNVGGNLRMFFPDCRVCCTRYPGMAGQADDGDGPRLVAWAVDRGAPPPTLAPLIPPGAAVESIAPPADRADHRYHTLKYAAVSGPRPRR